MKLIEYNRELKQYIVNYNFTTIDDEYIPLNTIYFYHKPNVNDIRRIINERYNKEINAKLLYGFYYNGNNIWLNTENQLNYTHLYNICNATNGSNLPIKIKVGSISYPKYITFNTIEEYNEFYLAVATYITKTIEEGWKFKDSIDYKQYELELQNING